MLELYRLTFGAQFEAALPLPVAQNIIEQQYQAKEQGYADAYPEASHEIIVFGGSPVGQLRWQVLSQSLRLIDISVHPNAQKGGVGRATVNRIKSKARELDLNCDLHFEAGSSLKDFYESLGFRIKEQTPTHVYMCWSRNQV